MRKPISQFDILGSLFIADRRHLTANGSAISAGNAT
jgi:hypothetical protein